TRVGQLHAWLTTGLRNPANLPLVLYIHCEGGCDRTGELSGAYAMGYLNKTWRQINEMNHEACGPRPFGCGNFIAARWYCLWLAARFSSGGRWAEPSSLVTIGGIVSNTFTFVSRS